MKATKERTITLVRRYIRLGRDLVREEFAPVIKDILIFRTQISDEIVNRGFDEHRLWLIGRKYENKGR